MSHVPEQISGDLVLNGKSILSHLLSNLQEKVHDEFISQGWCSNNFVEELAHLHSELSEAFEWYRSHKSFKIQHDATETKPEGVPIEFADVLIGMLYIAEHFGFDLGEALEIKRTWNMGRNYQKEGRQLHAPPGTPLRTGFEAGRKDGARLSDDAKTRVLRKMRSVDEARARGAEDIS